MTPRDFRAVQPAFFFGLDLGQRRDHSALVVLERLQEPLDTRDPVTFRPAFQLRFILRHAERFALATPYLEVVRRVAALVGRDFDPVFYSGAYRNPHRTLVVDASAVGAPVVELFRAAHLKATLEPIVITAAGAPSDRQVSRHDLITNLILLLESGLIRIPPETHHRRALFEELQKLTHRSGPHHDDLAMAAALAAWQALQTLPRSLTREALLGL